jgi:hypothetical protein
MAEVRTLARPLHDLPDLDGIVNAAAASEIVCLGEASLGSSEFYRWRPCSAGA